MSKKCYVCGGEIVKIKRVEPKTTRVFLVKKVDYIVVTVGHYCSECNLKYYFPGEEII
jgi:hypothetical protein